MDPYDLLVTTAAFLLGTIAVGRAARLVTHDDWPPMLALRLRWLTWAAQTERRERWSSLLTCPFCFAPYAAAVNLAWCLIAGAVPVGELQWAGSIALAWWVVNTWAAVSYLAAILVVRDEPVDE